MSHWKSNRRNILKASGLALGCAGLGLQTQTSRAQTSSDQKYLFVFCASGGANILDSYLPIASSESLGATATFGPVRHSEADGYVVQPSGSEIKCLNYPNAVPGYPAAHYSGGTIQQDFLSAHYSDIAVMTNTATSVNHVIAAQRALNGNGVNRGRTLLEAMAERHGDGLTIPACNMGIGGYALPGIDPNLAPQFKAQAIANPAFFALGTDSFSGVLPTASIDTQLTDYFSRAKKVRQELDEETVFQQTFRNSKLTQQFLERRDVLTPIMEEAELIKKLMVTQDNSAAGFPLADYGLESGLYVQDLLSQSGGHFTSDNLLTDDFMSQTALAYALARSGTSCATAIAPSAGVRLIEGANPYQFINPPLAFDFSHQEHFGSQLIMWDRILKAVDGLVRLLKATDDAQGGLMWDRSLIYIATEFGRTKKRELASSPGSGHEINNGNILISPLLNGNKVYGGVFGMGDSEEKQGLCYGFDKETGEGRPDDVDFYFGGANVKHENHVYATICKALDIDYDGRNVDAQDCMIKA
jgi:hypothetical protein